MSSQEFQQVVDSIATYGFHLDDNRIDQRTIDNLLTSLENASESLHARVHHGETYALRNILTAVPGVYELAWGSELMERARAILGSGARPVKAILFDKTANANWNLRWHQDNVISVKEKKDVPGFTAWTMKVGIPHVRPPVEVLSEMVAARIHIDDCPPENGAIKVVPGSHAHGRLTDQELNAWVSKKVAVVCAAKRGQILWMRPLLLHSSGRATNPEHRRVLHIEFAGSDLPGGLQWGV